MRSILLSAVIFCSEIAALASQPRITISELEQKINVLVNSDRQTRNLKPLELDKRLSEIARAHSQDMVKRGFFDHVNPDSEAPRDRLRRAGYHCARTVGENIFQNNLYSRVTISGKRKTYDWNSADEIAGSTVSGWMHSSGHRKNILSRAYQKTGIGVTVDAGGQVYVTQLFCG